MSASPPPARPGRRTPPRSFGGAARVALVAVMAALVAACSSPGRHADGPPPAPAGAPQATTSTTEPAPHYDPSPYYWDRSASPSLALGGGPTATLSAILAPELSGQWLVFGSRSSTAGTPAATVWTSPDGLTWSSAALQTGGAGSRANAAAQYKTATVVVGSVGQGANQQAAVWLSGSVSAPYEQQAVPLSDGPSVMTRVTAGVLGDFATGTVDGRFAMWWSTGGRSWSELPSAERVIGASPGARVEALLAEGSAVYAAGSVQDGPDTDAALWATADGLDWHMVGSAAQSFSGADSRAIYSLAPLGTGLVAVGAINRGAGWVPVSWISPDGASWSLPSNDFAGAPAAVGPDGPDGGAAVRSVAAIPTLGGSPAVVAAGGGPGGQAEWRSTDGLHWSSLSLPPAVASATSWRPDLTAATATTTIAVDAEPGQPYVLTDTPAGWAQPSANPAEFGPVRPVAVPLALQASGGHLTLSVEIVSRPQSIGPARATTDTLTSPDGVAWAVGPPGAADTPKTRPAPGAITLRVPDGWVAVDAVEGAPAGPGTVRSSGTVATRTWTSPSGSEWTPTGGLPDPAAARAASSPPTSLPPVASPDLDVNGLCYAAVPPAAAGTSRTSGATATTGPPAAQVVVAAVGAESRSVPATDPADGGAPTTVTDRTAAAWTRSGTVTAGAAWQPAGVTPVPPANGDESMSGCTGSGGALFAFGTAASPTGAPAPGLWRSATGAAWSQVPVRAFTADTPNPIVSLATSGPVWLAAANPDPSADPMDGTTDAATGPAATAGADAAVGPAATLDDGADGLWLSSDGGTTWQALDTWTAPWLGDEESTVDLVGFAVPAPGSTGTPVVVGVVDGRLAVWSGTAGGQTVP